MTQLNFIEVTQIYLTEITDETNVHIESPLIFLKNRKFEKFLMWKSNDCKIHDECWDVGEYFFKTCTSFRKLHVDEKEDFFILRFELINNDLIRIFRVRKDDNLYTFISTLVMDLVAVPSDNLACELTFLDSLITKKFIPSTTFNCIDINDLSHFWDSLLDFYEKFCNNVILSLVQYPYNIAARTLNNRVLVNIDKYYKSKDHPMYQKMTKDLFRSMFDAEGRIKDVDYFKECIINAGYEMDVLPDVLPFCLGLFDFSSSEKERCKLLNELKEEFYMIIEQNRLFSEFSEIKNKKINSYFSHIMCDTCRTDKKLNAFRKQETTGQRIITLLLRAYCLFNQDVNYLQGMNDLYVPIILAFLPKWNDDGEPVDDNNNVLIYLDEKYKLIDKDEYLPIIFWCFHSMLKNINHMKILSEITLECQYIENSVLNMLGVISPLVKCFLSKDKQKMLSFYSDFVLLFKRSISNIWDIWLPMNLFPLPKNSLEIFTTSLLVNSFSKLSESQSIVSAYKNFFDGLNITNTIKTMFWIIEKYPNIATSTKKENKTVTDNNSLKLLELGWINNPN